MDYEILMNGMVRVGDIAPEFEVESTLGKIKLSDYGGKWVVLFSYPNDFESSSTMEIIDFSNEYMFFEKEKICVVRVRNRF